MQLIYRAQTIESTPHPNLPSSRKPCALNNSMPEGSVKLIYRGQAFVYTPAPTQPYRKPWAMNWQFFKWQCLPKAAISRVSAPSLAHRSASVSRKQEIVSSKLI